MVNIVSVFADMTELYRINIGATERKEVYHLIMYPR